MSESIRETCQTAIRELLAAARLHRGDIVVIGCSSSEVLGEKIGTHSSYETAEEIHAAIAPILAEEGLWLAAQCCEHLNRALIIEADLARELRLDIVNVVPQPKAGGSFATCAYKYEGTRGCGIPPGRRRSGHRRHLYWNAHQAGGGSGPAECEERG